MERTADYSAIRIDYIRPNNNAATAFGPTTITNSIITNLTSTDGTITNLTSTDGTVTNLTSTDGTITNLTSTDGTITNLTSTDGTVTNLTSTDGTITNLTSTDGTITNLTTTDGTISNLIMGNTVNQIVTDTTLSGNSDNNIPTERAVKTYVDDFITIADNPTGFTPTSRTGSSLSFVNASRTFTIAPTGADFDYYQYGIRYVVNTADSIVISNTEGNHYIYYNGSSLLETTTWNDNLLLQLVLVTIIYWDAANSVYLYMCDERHGLGMAPYTHYCLHYSVGTIYHSGIAPTVVSIDGTGNIEDDARVSISAGVIFDEDLIHNVPLKISTGPWMIFYRDGATGLWRSQASGALVLTTGTGRAAYNQWTGAIWKQTEVGNNDFVLGHIVATGDPVLGNLVIQGQQVYGNQNTARVGANTEVNNLITVGLPMPEFTFIGTVIYQTSNGYLNTYKSRTRTTDTGADFVDFRASHISPSAASSSHSNLSNLTNDDHSQYALLAGRAGDILYIDQVIGRSGVVASTFVTIAANGAITIPTNNTLYLITKAGVCAMTIGDPTAGTHDGLELTFMSNSNNQHTLDLTGTDINGAATGVDTGTWAAVFGGCCTIVAYNAVWYLKSCYQVNWA